MDYEEYEKYQEPESDEALKEAIWESLNSPRLGEEPTPEEIREWEAVPPIENPTDKSEKPSVSLQKLAANRANAQRSTGPKTQEGKNRSRFNAVKHGLTARYFPSIIKLGTDEAQEFEKQRLAFYEHFAPVGPVEELLVEKIVVELRRYNRAIAPEQHPSVANSGFFAQVVDKLTRYQTAVNRQLMQAMNELERVQSKRRAEEGEKQENEAEVSSD